MATPATSHREYGTWLGGRVEFPGGWAGDLAWNDGSLWVAWASCIDEEPELLTAPDRTWPLRPGVTLDEWRRRSAQTEFRFSMARLGDDGTQDVRELSRGLHAGDGPSLSAVAGRPEPAGVWVERHDGGSALLATVNASRVETVAQGGAAMLGPRAASDPGGALRAVWQQWPGRGAPGIDLPRIFGATRGGGDRGTWGPPDAISPQGQSAWAPAIASGPDGGLWCAWDGWDGMEYQVYACYAPPGGEWGQVVQVSVPEPRLGYLNFGPDIAASTQKAWVVWSRTTPWGQINYRFNHIKSLHARVLTVEGDGSLLVQPVPGRPVQGELGQLPVAAVPFLWAQDPEFINPQAPRVRLSPDGDLVVFFRQFLRTRGDRDFGWATCAVRHTGDDWSAPVRLTDHRGFPDSAYGVVPGGRDSSTWVLAAHAGESYPDLPGSNPVGDNRVIVESVELGADSMEEHAGLHLSLSAPTTLAVRPVALDEPVRRLTAGGQTYDLLFGDLHRHSTYSKCVSSVDGDPLDHWRWAHDVEELDFYAITEHLEFMSYVEWRRVEDLGEALSGNGRVITLGGFELILPEGHTNFFYADQSISHDLRVACLSSMGKDLSEIWPKLDEWVPEGKVLAIRHFHGGAHEDHYAARYEPVVEIIQTRGESPAWVQSLWRKGFRVGVIGSSDHSRNAPFIQALTGLWLPEGERSREAVMDALRARRTFATNGVKMGVLLTATGSNGGSVLVMGEEGKVEGAPRLTAEVSGTRILDRVEFYRNETPIHVEAIGAPRASVEYVDGDAPPGEHIYWVRVTQLAERPGNRPGWGVAYSSPVWATV